MSEKLTDGTCHGNVIDVTKLQTVNIYAPTYEHREITSEEILELESNMRKQERQRCINLIREQVGVYLPGYRLDKLIADIEKGE